MPLRPTSSSSATGSTSAGSRVVGSPGTQTHPSPQWLAKMVKAARCMRRHSVRNFPDPDTTIPSPKVLGGGGQISNIDGVVFVFPAVTIDTQSPAFTRAAKMCGFPLHNH